MTHPTLIETRRRAAIPDQMPARGETGSQLGQLVYWWMWVEGGKVRDLIKRFRSSQATVYRGLVVAGASSEFILNVAVEIGRVFGHTPDLKVLEGLSRQPAAQEKKPWRTWAKLLLESASSVCVGRPGHRVLPVRVRRRERKKEGGLCIALDPSDVNALGLVPGERVLLFIGDLVYISGRIGKNRSWLQTDERCSGRLVDRWLRAAGFKHGDDANAEVMRMSSLEEAEQRGKELLDGLRGKQVRLWPVPLRSSHAGGWEEKGDLWIVDPKDDGTFDLKNIRTDHVVRLGWEDVDGLRTDGGSDGLLVLRRRVRFTATTIMAEPV